MFFAVEIDAAEKLVRNLTDNPFVFLAGFVVVSFFWPLISNWLELFGLGFK